MDQPHSPSTCSPNTSEKFSVVPEGISIQEYSLRFHTLATARNELPLLTTFRQDLKPALRLQLAYQDDSIDLERFIQLSLRVAARMHSCLECEKLYKTLVLRQPEVLCSSETAAKPVQMDNTRLSMEECQRRLTQSLCIYCGSPGHFRRNCSIQPPRLAVSVVRSSPINVHPLTTIVTITILNQCVSVDALLDSGSAGNFISTNSSNLPGSSMTSPTRCNQSQENL